MALLKYWTQFKLELFAALMDELVFALRLLAYFEGCSVSLTIIFYLLVKDIKGIAFLTCRNLLVNDSFPN